MEEVTALELYHGDCREIMASWPEASIDAIVTDPPYGLGFMGKEWDTFNPEAVARNAEKRARQKPIPAGGRNGDKPRGRVAGAWAAGRYDRSRPANQGFQDWFTDWAVEALRLLKPGGHLVAFGGPRTYHRLACAIEDAGFEIRDCLMWIFGSGFPKSLNLHGEYEGWGTALKPAYEPIVLARKPLSGTVAGNVEAYGTGALNIEASRIDTTESRGGGAYSGGARHDGTDAWRYRNGEAGEYKQPVGRWPANVLLDEEAAALLDAQSGNRGAGGDLSGRELSKPFAGPDIYGVMDGWREWDGYRDSGGASRFFYTAKASRTEREAMLEDMEPTRRSDGREKDIENPRLRTNARRNDHPTVKPVDLMRWLCKLITPPGGLILEPFMGSGSTGMAALDAGFRFRGIDQDEHYVDLARRRIEGRHVFAAPPEPGPENISPRLL